MIVREVLAQFAIDVDAAPLTKADKAINRLSRRVTDFAVGAGAMAAAVGYAGFSLVQMASDADEALNVLNSTFKDQAAGVVEWSKTVGAAMGRSEYTLQESVGKFGAFLTPVFRGLDVDIAKMSESLSVLAVDLASFYNTKDAKAIQDLFSGMSGETEAVRKYGIDISDKSLDAFNMSRGDNRNMRDLSQTEKAMLRYDKIMRDTALAQGDAVKTADEWANQLKRFQERLKTIGVNMGKVILPYAHKILNAINTIVTSTIEWYKVLEERSSTLRTIVYMLTAGAVAYAAQWAIINRQLLASIAHSYHIMALQRGWYQQIQNTIKATAQLAVPFLVIEDVITWLRGGQSLLGSTINDLLGISDSLGAVTRAFEILIGYADRFQTIMKNVGGEVARAFDIFGVSKGPDWNLGKDPLDAYHEGEKRKAGSFREAVIAGNAAGAVAQRRTGETEQAAYQRFMWERGAALTAHNQGKFSDSGKVSINDDDVQQGLVPSDFLSAMSEYAAKGTIGGSVPQSFNGVTPATKAAAPINITVNSSKADAKAVADEVVDKLMRATAASTGEGG